MDVISFLHKMIVYGHFSYLNMASKMVAKGHVTIFIIISSNESFIVWLRSVKVSQQ